MTSPPGRRERAATAAFAVTLLVSLVALFLPEAPDAGVEAPGLDKVAHVLIFALLSVTAVRRFGRSLRVVLLLLGYAIGSELFQGVVLPERGGDVLDLLADVVGAMAGLVVADAWRRSRAGSVARTSAPDEVAR